MVTQGHDFAKPKPSNLPRHQPPHLLYPLSPSLTHVVGSSQPPSGSRRPHPRARRSMSSRFISSESGRDDDDDELGRRFFLDHIIQNSSGLDPSSMDQQSVDNVLVRQIQLVRGSMTSKMVASKMALRSLQSVNIDDLPEAERSRCFRALPGRVQARQGLTSL